MFTALNVHNFKFSECQRFRVNFYWQVLFCIYSCSCWFLGKGGLWMQNINKHWRISTLKSVNSCCWLSSIKYLPQPHIGHPKLRCTNNLFWWIAIEFNNNDLINSEHALNWWLQPYFVLFQIHSIQFSIRIKIQWNPSSWWC